MTVHSESNPSGGDYIRQLERDVEELRRKLETSHNEAEERFPSLIEARALIAAGLLGLGGAGFIAALILRVILRPEQIRLIDPVIGVALALQRGFMALGSWAPITAFGLGAMIILGQVAHHLWAATEEGMRVSYGKIFYRSIKLALISTLACLILGYPVAYIISRMKASRRNLLIMLFIVPMWMNFLLRTYAWLPILGKNGLINNILEALNIAPISFLYNDGAVLLGMVYNFIPFMILPIYTVLTKMDQNLINAASDLGASRRIIFKKIIFPLSFPGVISGITMVFMPAVSTFVISSLLGGGQYMLLGNLIEQQFTTLSDWNLGSSISILMMIVILISMALMNKFDSTDKEGSVGLW